MNATQHTVTEIHRIPTYSHVVIVHSLDDMGAYRYQVVRANDAVILGGTDFEYGTAHAALREGLLHVAGELE